MADFFKILGQSKPAATTLTDLYTVPAVTQTSVSTIVVCNQSATPTTYRISVAAAGAADALSQYLVYDVTIQGNETQTYTLGITLATTDKVRCYAGLASISFTAFGVEIA